MNISEMTLIGSGAQADIYLCDGKAVKLYKPGADISEGLREAQLQRMAFEKNLPVPEVFGTTEIEGRTAIIMEYVQGRSFGEIMLADVNKALDYLSLSVDIQMRIHTVSVEGFPDQSEKLRSDIQNTTYLSAEQRSELLHNLQQLHSQQESKPDNRLCHGDYHVLNLIQTDSNVKVIDWICASGGSPAADVCRSYVLYLLNMKDIAEVYLDIYCDKAQKDKQEVLNWLPVIAGARLNENVEKHHIEILLGLV